MHEGGGTATLSMQVEFRFTDNWYVYSRYGFSFRSYLKATRMKSLVRKLFLVWDFALVEIEIVFRVLIESRIRRIHHD